MFKVDNAKEEEYVNRPPILDGKNYDCWKACIVSFLRSMDNRTWKAVIKEWSPPKITTKDNIETVKPEKDWTTLEDEKALGNSHALNSIYNGVDNNIFRIINTCVSTKEV